MLLRMRTAVALVFVMVAVGVAAQTPPPARGAPAPAPKAAPGSLERFTVTSDGHPIAVWARRPANPRGALLLVHGMTWSARPDFDLQVPGMQRSVLTSFASQGIAAYTVDLRGYGETPRDPSGWLTPRRSAADVLNVLIWIASQHPALPKPALVGWSRGAAIAQMVAQAQPSRLSALTLFGFVSTPTRSSSIHRHLTSRRCRRTRPTRPRVTSCRRR